MQPLTVHGISSPYPNWRSIFFIHRANQLLSAVLSARPSAEVAALIDALIDDVVQHFKDEEMIIAAAGFPEVAAHAIIHRELVDSALNLVDRFHAGTLLLGELFQFLAHDVVARHMLGADREFFTDIERRGAVAIPC